MTHEDSQRLISLHNDWHNKKRRYEELGMANTYGLTTQEQRDQSAVFFTAYAEMNEAKELLESACHPRDALSML